MKKYQIKIFDGSSFSDSILFVETKSGKVELEFQSNFLNTTVEDSFPFLALNKIRERLEEMKIKILCNGSRVDVYPSGMLLISPKAYQLEMGKKAIRMVNIFMPAEDYDKVGTIKEQKDFFDKWYLSIPK